MPDLGIIDDNYVNEVDKEAFGSLTTITIAYTTHLKKRAFIDNLKKFAQTWRGNLQPLGQSVKVNLVPLFEDDGITLTRTVQRLHVHAILHKRTDDMAAVLAHEDQNALCRLSVLSDILQRGVPAIVSDEGPIIYKRLPTAQIDPLSGIWRLVDRAQILTVIDDAFGGVQTDGKSKSIGFNDLDHQHNNVRTLPWTMLSTLMTNVRDIENVLEAKGVQFPVIIKPRLACGDPVSHCMVVASNSTQVASALEKVFRASGTLSEFGENVAVQQFVPRHDNVLFKLYALGAHVLVQSRLSIGFAKKVERGIRCASNEEKTERDRNDKNCTENDEFFYFDSQALPNKSVVKFNEYTGRGIRADVVKPDHKLAKNIIHKLRQQLDGISLLGADVVYDVDEKAYFIVDVNYFPGYKHFPEAHSYLLQLVVDQVVERGILKGAENECTLSTHLTNLDVPYRCQPFFRNDTDTLPNLIDSIEDGLQNDQMELGKSDVSWNRDGRDDNGSIGEDLVKMAVWNGQKDCLEPEVDVIGRGGCING